MEPEGPKDPPRTTQKANPKKREKKRPKKSSKTQKQKPVLAREREARLNGENSQSMFTTTISEITYQQLLKIIEFHTNTSKNVSERL